MIISSSKAAWDLSISVEHDVRKNALRTIATPSVSSFSCFETLGLTLMQ